MINNFCQKINMKYISTTALLVCFALLAQAQTPESFDPFKDRQLIFDVINICAVLSGIYLISSFILQIIKQHYGYRIKNRILDKGTEENIVKQLIQPDKKDIRNNILQWFFMLASIGVGLTLVRLIQPFGIHSVAIMAFSVAAGFGANYYFIRQSE
jgi:hypothetical protein